MIKPAISGSLFAKMFPGASKFFQENAPTDVFNQAEQEAAVIHQQLQAAVQMPLEVPAPAAVVPATPAAVVPQVPAGQPTAAELMTLFTASQQENATLKATNTGLQAAISELQPKAASWDAYQSSLQGIRPNENKPTGSTTPANELGNKEQAHLSHLQELKAKYPNLTAGLDIPDPE